MGRRRKGAAGLLLALALGLGGTVWAAPLAYVTGPVAGWRVVHRGEVQAAREEMPLEEGDVLVGGAVSRLPAVLHPLALAVPREDGGVRLARQEASLGELWPLAVPYVEFLAKEPLRGLDYSRGDALLRPGLAASLLPGYGVELAWVEEAGSRVTVRDERGAVVFAKAAAGQSVRLGAEEVAQLAPGRRYTWQVEGLGASFRLEVLPRERAGILLEGLRRLEEDHSVQPEVRTIRKAAYLRLVSDMQRGINLYWLSLQLAGEVRGESYMTERYRKVADRLREAYVRQLVQGE